MFFTFKPFFTSYSTPNSKLTSLVLSDPPLHQPLSQPTSIKPPSHHINSPLSPSDTPPPPLTPTPHQSHLYICDDCEIYDQDNEDDPDGDDQDHVQNMIDSHNAEWQGKRLVLQLNQIYRMRLGIYIDIYINCMRLRIYIYKIYSLYCLPSFS